jgi:hypothetical protein
MHLKIDNTTGMFHLKMTRLGSIKSSWAENLNQQMHLSTAEDIIGYALYLTKITQF